MKVLLLGSNGQLGTDIQIAFDNCNSNIHLIPMTRIELNVEVTDAIEKVLEPIDFDILINCTSYHKTDEVEKNADKAVTVNAHAVEKIAKVCQLKKAKLFHISTDYVFSGRKNEAYIEEDCPGPLNVYGATKYMGEVLAKSYCDSTYILRVASLFGVAGASGKGGNFVETIIKIAKEQGEVKVVNDIKMSPTSTKWIANAILKLIENNAPADTYHMVNSGAATWYDLAFKAIDLIGADANVCPVNSEYYPTIAERPVYSVLDNSKLEKFVGVIPKWEDALTEYLLEKGYL